MKVERTHPHTEHLPLTHRYAHTHTDTTNISVRHKYTHIHTHTHTHTHPCNAPPSICVACPWRLALSWGTISHRHVGHDEDNPGLPHRRGKKINVIRSITLSLSLCPSFSLSLHLIDSIEGPPHHHLALCISVFSGDLCWLAPNALLICAFASLHQSVPGSGIDKPVSPSLDGLSQCSNSLLAEMKQTAMDKKRERERDRHLVSWEIMLMSGPLLFTQGRALLLSFSSCTSLS